MDNLTHTAVGLFLSRAGLNRWTPGATPILLLAANAPDIDIATWLGGSINYLHYHRHLTHAFLALPLLALLPVLLVRAARIKVRWGGAVAISLLGVASHLLLDWTNMYGIRLLLPFSEEWFRLDSTSVLDLWIWAVLLLAVAGPLISRLVGLEISSGKKTRVERYGRGWAIVALCFVAVYTVGRGVAHGRAVETLDSRLYRGEVPRRVAALPNVVNPLLWRGVVETGQFYAIADVNLTGEFDPSRALYLHKPVAEPVIEAAKQSTTIREFLRFSQFPLWKISPVLEPEGGQLAEVFDLRFGTPQNPGFMASALLDSRLQVRKASFQFGNARPR